MLNSPTKAVDTALVGELTLEQVDSDALVNLRRVFAFPGKVHQPQSQCKKITDRGSHLTRSDCPLSILSSKQGSRIHEL